jgi:hypothetical protein
LQVDGQKVIDVDWQQVGLTGWAADLLRAPADGVTSLMLATANCSADLVQALLAKGADNRVDDNQCRPRQCPRACPRSSSACSP